MLSQIWIDNASIYNEALEYLESEDYGEAATLFSLLGKKGLNNANINHKLGKCYLNIEGKAHEAIPFLEAAAEYISDSVQLTLEEKNAPKETYFLLAAAYRINKQFDKAIRVLKTYKEIESKAPIVAFLENQIEICHRARLMDQYPVQAEFIPIGTPGQNACYNPVVIGNGTFFYMDKRPFYDAIIQAEIQSDVVVSPENITPMVRSDGEHTITGADKSGELLLLVAYDAQWGYELYYSKKEKGKWSKNKKFPEPINSRFNETFASLSEDGNTLYFCSNRQNGTGALDIYSSTRNKDGSWGTVVNLGKIVNTHFNEHAVFQKGDKLFFSSEGHLNMGGSDLFVSELQENGKWGTPKNLGAPISTPGNDYYLQPSTENEFYTYRHNNDSDEGSILYKVVVPDNIYEKKVLVKGGVNFSEEIAPKSIEIILNSKELGIERKLTSDEEGNFGLLLQPANYTLEYVYNDTISAKQEIVINSAQVIDELLLEAPEWLIGTGNLKEGLRVILLSDILFPFNNYAIPRKEYARLDSLSHFLMKNKEITIIITGYADYIGSQSYNLKLSENRAKAVKDYIVKKGVPSHKVSTKSYGEKEPVAFGKTTNGDDLPEGRKYNRRVSFDIQKTVDGIKVEYKNIVPSHLKIP